MKNKQARLQVRLQVRLQTRLFAPMVQRFKRRVMPIIQMYALRKNVRVPGVFSHSESSYARNMFAFWKHVRSLEVTKMIN